MKFTFSLCTDTYSYCSISQTKCVLLKEKNEFLGKEMNSYITRNKNWQIDKIPFI